MLSNIPPQSARTTSFGGIELKFVNRTLKKAAENQFGAKAAVPALAESLERAAEKLARSSEDGKIVLEEARYLGFKSFKKNILGIDCGGKRHKFELTGRTVPKDGVPGKWKQKVSVTSDSFFASGWREEFSFAYMLKGFEKPFKKGIFSRMLGL